MNLNQIYSDIKINFPNLEIYQNHPLFPYTTVKIGGPADIFIHTYNSDEFKKILEFILKNFGNWKLEIGNLITIGNGSNVLISDSGLRGLVIKNDSDDIELLPENKIKVSSGTQLSSLINYSLDHNLLGLEEFAYIPSTIGGAIAGDIHGNNKNHFSKFIDSVEKTNDFIISATLNLSSGDSTSAKQEVQGIIQKKSQIQSMNSLGSVFKNKAGQNPTGMIIDQDLNLKGYSIGGAQISPNHGNFIINNGSATAKDYLSLINLIQSKAQEKLGFQFELEIKLLGDF